MVNLLSGTKTNVFNIGSIKIYTNSTMPVDEIGNKGDLWIDTNTPKLWQKGTGTWFSIDAQATADNILYVTKNGNDSFDGRSLVTAKRTVKNACSTAQTLLGTSAFEAGRALIIVAAGVFTEDCPIITPAGVSIIGMDRQATAIKATNPNSNVFHMSSGCHYSNFSVIDHRLSPTAFSITPSGFAGFNDGLAISTSQTGWAFSFAPGAVITESPRVINVFSRSGSGVFGSPSYVPGGGGILADSSTISNSSTTSQIITEDVVQINLGGISYKAVNNGVIQCDDGHSSFSQFDALSIAGGHIMLRDSTTAYGNYGLWADGSRTLPDTSTFGSLIEASGHTFTYAGAGVDFTKISTSQGGTGVVDENKFTITRNDGRVFMTGSDERGNFYVGEIVPGSGGNSAKPKFRIMQDKDIIDGRTFYQSIFGFMVPMSLLLTRRK